MPLSPSPARLNGPRTWTASATASGKPTLRQEVEELLKAHGVGNPLDRPLRDVSATGAFISSNDEVSASVGDRVGPYKLLERIGEGGMGEVWVADQLEPIKRRVALKLIKPGMDSRSVLGRFEAERQALAVMDHPNIAKVLDAGTTPDGRPFFVMELVKGTPITEFCDARKLTPKERLELFIPVCQAIQHAHMKGIIHRDIKPSNVLVALHDEVPVPKVIDFGVAKAIGQQLTEKTIYTGFGALIGTPAYMAPEQASFNQLDVDTRADVYALGVLLYELLAGSPPIEQERLKKVALDEMLRMVRDEEPQRPSHRLSTSQAKATIAATRQSDPVKLSQLMRGELDWIVMKALEKDRTRRYDTANGLAKDVQRYLSGDSVEACPPTLTYRLRKTYRKNRTAVRIASAFIVLAVAAVAVAATLAIQARRAEMVAVEQERAAVSAQKEEAEQRQRAEASERSAIAARESLRGTHYAASMNLINTAWESDNVARAVELLEENRPKPGEVDHRGFEWHYWDRLCHAERRTVSIAADKNNVGSSKICSDGSRIVHWKNTYPSEGTGFCTIRVLEAAGMNEVCSFQIPVPESPERQYVSLDISRNGSRVAAQPYINRPGNTKAPVVVYDVASQKPIFTQECTAGHFTFNSEGTLLATVQGPAPSGIVGIARPWTEVKIWDIAHPEKPPVVIKNDSEDGMDMAPFFTRDSSRLGYKSSSLRSGGSGWSERIRICDVSTGRSQINHAVTDGYVSACAFSFDGTQLITVGDRGTISGNGTQTAVTLYDGAAGDKLTTVKTIPVPSDGSSSLFNIAIKLSSDGQRLALTNRMLPTVVIDLINGTIVQRIKSPARVHDVSFITDGTRLITLGGTGSSETGFQSVMQEWNVGPLEKPVPTPMIARDSTIISENGQRTATFARLPRAPFPVDPDASPHVTIRDANGRKIFVFKKHTKPGLGVRISPDGRWIYSVGPDGEDAYFWEADTGIVRWSQPQTDTPIRASIVTAGSSFSPDSHWFAFPVNQEVKIVSLPDFQERFKIATGITHRITFSPDSRRLVCENRFEPRGQNSPSEIIATLWDVEAGRLIKTWPNIYGSIGSVRFSPDSRIVCVPDFQKMELRNASTGELQTTISDNWRPGRVIFSPDSTRLSVASNLFATFSQATGVYDVATGKLLFRLEGHTSQILFIAFSPDGRRIASVSNAIANPRVEIKLWDAATGRELLTLNGISNGRINLSSGLRFSPDGHKLTLKQDGNFGDSGLVWTAPEDQIWDATPRPEPAK